MDSENSNNFDNDFVPAENRRYYLERNPLLIDAVRDFSEKNVHLYVSE